MTVYTEELVEDAALEWLEALGYEVLHGPDLGPDAEAAERASWDDVFLGERLRSAVERINPDVPADVCAEAIKKIQRPESQDTLTENHRIHRLLTEGVPIEHRNAAGQVRTITVHVVDFQNPELNDWATVNQVTVIENRNRRPDVLVYLNGVPVALFELKSAVAHNATLKSAFNQVQTYRRDIPSVFNTNALTVISDGTAAAMSTFTAHWEHYAPWKTIDGEEITGTPSLDILIKGVFPKTRFLDILKNFIVFSEETITEKDGTAKQIHIKRAAKYHQYWAVNKAVESTIRASQPDGDRRGGVIWHTQGSGKSFEMVFYAAKIMRDIRMANPTLVFLTDRNDLDDQLFAEVFAPAHILPESATQADTRDDLRAKLRRASGGIIFTTLQKFGVPDGDNPVLTDRRNVVVVADEAHRSQYGLKSRLDGETGQLKAGFAKHMRDALPGATFLGFTGTPIESADKSTRSVFGDYIDIYDLTRAVDDGATVKIYYESRLAKIGLNEDDLDTLDELAEQIVGDSEEELGEKAKSKWARLEAIVGSESRLDMIAADIVEHWENRRNSLLGGKAMIVTMSRRIAVRLYEKITALRPDWHSEDPSEGRIKVVMTGSASDPQNFQAHLYDKQTRNQLKARAKNPEDSLELVIVRDMWLTGFDSPSMNTMYVDKTMRGAGLMQAIARVNRTFKDKTGGLIVDYIGIFTRLQNALGEYSPTDREQAGVPIDEVVAVMQEKYGVVRDILYGVRYTSTAGMSSAQRQEQYNDVLNFVLADAERARRFRDQTLALVKAFSLAGTRDEAAAIRDDVALFAAVRAGVEKFQDTGSGLAGSSAEEMDSALGDLVNAAIAADKVIDVYGFSGQEKPELSLLSDEFLGSLVHDERANLQLTMLRKLLDDEVRSVKRRNVVKGRAFSERLDDAVNKYTNQALTAAEVIAELAALAKDIRDEPQEAERLGLSVAEMAFYDAIRQNDAAVEDLGDETLKQITVELVQSVQRSVAVDWTSRKSVRAKMRRDIKRLLRHYKYPPDKREEAVQLVLEQAEVYAKAA
ncbi:type I restriction endonuclease subunit R [Nesterenkonia cremea]|uniref:Type I restriction enzyme endonuclease subunit n=1 Tax=Nesterenkonia cremea TaxID=1882340 RepID=A0A917EQI3_9MICC|nr:type I restriction endonuclease subunit R [Nesterenkonia cremea]GGE75604.1 DEAD/DEAH box helicase [Nesterenkonia cremea]